MSQQCLLPFAPALAAARRKSRNGISSSYEIQDGKAFKALGVTRYEEYKMCPRCHSHNNVRRPMTDVCMACAMREGRA